MKSKEEIWINILKEAKRREDLIYRVVPETSWTYPIAELVYKAMEEYASQFTAQASPLPISGDEEKLVRAVRNLVALKDWKDQHGKDEHYEQFQPEAWVHVREALKPYQSPVKETI